MEVINKLVEDVPLPKMAPVRQMFDDTHLADIEAALRRSFAESGIAQRVAPGATVAVAVGSRGLAELPLLVRVTIDELKRLGTKPFIVPAMGSHGGATAEGQTLLLSGLGVTEESAGCEIRSSMETVELGRLPNGLPVLMDRHAMAADHIAMVNRVKPHTSFSAPLESGLAKMIAIGLGKQKGAESCHALGFGEMGDNVLEMAKVKLSQTPILFGVATVENAYDKVAIAEVVPAENILERELELLRLAKAAMPRILFNPLDVLVVEKMGKEFSGTGTDPNITGRAGTPYIAPTQEATRFVILDLSLKSGGNATGVGLADIITRRLFDKVDLQATYANHITSTTLVGAKLPMAMESDRLAIQCALKTSNLADLGSARMVRLRNTLQLEHIWISEALLGEAQANGAVEVLGPAEPWPFDAAGNLAERVPA